MTIKIVTDSTAYLSPEILARYDLRVVPLKVLFGKTVYRDGVDLSSAEFHRLLATASELPTTSQPAVGEFEAVYAGLISQGHEVLSIHISGQLSGTVESARAAVKSFPQAQIHVVDSLTTSIGLAMMVIRSAEAAAQGRDTGYILERLEWMIRDTTLLFVVDTLEYLEKGGRIGPARALLGTLLKIKPILKLDNGLVAPFTTVRTKHKAIAFMIDQLAAAAGGRQVYIGIGHVQVPDEMDELQESLCNRLECVELCRGEIGPVVSTHTGPGLLGVAICPVESAP